jgi:hypothetical protein
MLIFVIFFCNGFFTEKEILKKADTIKKLESFYIILYEEKILTKWMTYKIKNGLNLLFMINNAELSQIILIK